MVPEANMIEVKRRGLAQSANIENIKEMQNDEC